MRYNGLNNMFFSLCQINDNHSFHKFITYKENKII
ncbi:pentapeptide repeat-containing protein [Escherichia coli]|uniref:Pentapeptide repeat-containing protein n=1 Tax=Escherichia coli TaxID=562 RepID=A0A376L353_ECOLX|nr:pentapeptide repeat-containing protein [Escherichia coli]